MAASDQRTRAEELRRLHDAPELLVLPNVWDVASARTVAAVPGCRAIATASWAVAAARGVSDGEALPLAEMLDAIGRIAAAVELPVTADLERGYGTDADGVGRAAGEAIAVGAVGVNLEDGTGDGRHPLRAAGEHAGRVAAVRAEGDRRGVPVVINARTDVFLAAVGAPADRLAHALRRGRTYLDAGADIVFVPGVQDRATIEGLVSGLGGRLSLLAGPAAPPLAELERLGVARVSFGPGTMGVAHAALARAAALLLHGGDYPADLAFRPPVGT